MVKAPGSQGGKPKARKTRRKPAETSALLIFEIEGWEPEYHFSVNGKRDPEGPYSEIVLIQVHAVCRYPEKVFGRKANFSLYAERGMMQPPELKYDRDWRPNGLGYVKLPPTNGHGYARLPHDSMGVVVTALAHGRFRYLSLHGTPLSHGSSNFHSIGFSNDEGLDEEGHVRPLD